MNDDKFDQYLYSLNKALESSSITQDEFTSTKNIPFVLSFTRYFFDNIENTERLAQRKAINNTIH